MIDRRDQRLERSSQKTLNMWRLQLEIEIDQ